jgi:D-alanyl-D-alanine carboxypeptidase/D-alanyl-D-alanine-endopeptidase (penicillin-binding protein 4)
VTRALTVALTVVAFVHVSDGLKAAGYDLIKDNTPTAEVADGPQPVGQASPLVTDLDAIFSDPILARGLIAARVDSLRTGETIYARNADKLVMPASNMKIVTMTVAAEKLGWDFVYTTHLDAIGPITNGVLRGDLVVTGGGDPTIVSHDDGPAPLFAEWAAAVRKAGITRVDGRVLGDDSFFDRDEIGMGWSWDDLVFGYSAGISGLSYNENQVSVRVAPAAAVGAAAVITLRPARSHGLNVINRVTTAARPADAPANDPRLRASISYDRAPGSSDLIVSGTIPLGANPVSQDVAVPNPTQFFVTSLRDALIDEGIAVYGDAGESRTAIEPTMGARTNIATRTSPPLSVIGGYFMKVSQNFVAETLLKTIGAVVKGQGSTAAGRSVVQETLRSWGVPDDAIVMRDGSGLSRYNYVTTGAIVTMLTHMWKADALRGPFAAVLPVAAHDGTLSNRMKNSWLDSHVQAKTGTIANTRSLSGYLEAKSGERVVFSIIANHFTAPSAQIDAIAEKALALIAERR